MKWSLTSENQSVKILKESALSPLKETYESGTSGNIKAASEEKGGCWVKSIKGHIPLSRRQLVASQINLENHHW